ncbi:unnamed protein product [Prorocentrum cordatum]|uniref:Uncharacterized protein n=1 Tax=Prorocentrum cordatum TaxID=2364126 RepID=A0ABN9Q1Q6_9DINO|nr:unnamed protein product [Polarella glacialis]
MAAALGRCRAGRLALGSASQRAARAIARSAASGRARAWLRQRFFCPRPEQQFPSGRGVAKRRTTWRKRKILDQMSSCVADDTAADHQPGPEKGTPQ